VIRLKTLLLKFSGPLQSWGTVSDFETRHTDLYPSKSAVIGIIAGSFGYRRNENVKIQKLNELDFAVRIDQKGSLLRDFHTAKSYKENGDILRTYVTNRYYVEDGVFIVAIGHKDDDFINEVVYELQHPYFQQYMGRRSLPVNLDFYLKMVEEDVVKSLENLPWQASEWYQRENWNIKELTIYADAELMPESKKHFRRDYVMSLDQKSRRFDYRYEAIRSVNIKKDAFHGEHDAFAALGE